MAALGLAVDPAALPLLPASELGVMCIRENDMFTKIFNKKKTTENEIASHTKYSTAYKIVGIIGPGTQSYKYKGYEINYSVAQFMLCVKLFGSDDEYLLAWKSEEYKHEEDAKNVLKAEARRISDFLRKRIEVISYCHEKKEHEVVAIYNKNERSYLIAATGG